MAALPPFPSHLLLDGLQRSSTNIRRALLANDRSFTHRSYSPGQRSILLIRSDFRLDALLALVSREAAKARRRFWNCFFC